MEPARLEFRAMGSPCALYLYGGKLAEETAKLARAEVERLERKYTRYRDDSLTSEINRSAGSEAGIRVDAETAALLDYAETSFRESRGLFDLTSGVLRRAWDLRSGRVPTHRELRALRAQVGWDKVRWRKPRLVLPKPGMEIDFGGCVKEYAADRVAALCRGRGVGHGLVDLGGDLAVVGPHPDGRPWQVGIRHPRRPHEAMATVALRGGGIASSGDYERCMVVDGKRYGHVLNPRTGWPVRGLASVTVVASHCLIAGTATTVAMLMGRSAGADWLDGLGLPNARMDEAGRLSGTLDVIRPRESAAA